MKVKEYQGDLPERRRSSVMADGDGEQVYEEYTLTTETQNKAIDQNKKRKEGTGIPQNTY